VQSIFLIKTFNMTFFLILYISSSSNRIFCTVASLKNWKHRERKRVLQETQSFMSQNSNKKKKYENNSLQCLSPLILSRLQMSFSKDYASVHILYKSHKLNLETLNHLFNCKMFKLVKFETTKLISCYC